MSTTSGTASQVIDLPKGGGALQGIGETFAPDLHTGTGNFTIPIALPPGRNGFQPDLKLVYSTGNGHGPFGLGWSLSIPGIRRKTAKGIPSYNGGDVFILSGAEDLVAAEGSASQTRYRPRTEGLFARIIHHHDSTNNYWHVQSRDGIASVYGSREASGNDPAVVADPANRTRVFAWNLTETRDPFGNRIQYEYLRDQGHRAAHTWDQLYIHRIQYADYHDSSGAEQFLISVTFEYADLPDHYDAGAPDRQRIFACSNYRAGFEMRTRKRCKRIKVESHPEEGGERHPQLVRTYALTYLDEDERSTRGESAQQTLPKNGASLLRQIEIIGHDGFEQLPPLEFSYTQFVPEERKFFSLQGSELPAQVLNDPNLELVDLFSNGLPDMLETSSTMRYWRNLGGGRFDRPREMRDAPAGHTLADPGVQIIDANGDGRPDLLVTQQTLAGYFPTCPGGTWDRRSFQRYRVAPSFSLDDPEVQLVDLDGDGVTDAIRSGTRLECFFNDAQDGWKRTKFVERQALAAFPNVNFSDPRVKWGDMTGDGLQDIVLVYDGHVAYWPNLGHGNWGRRIAMQHGPRFPYDYDPRRILLGDVDGDGLADIVYVDHSSVTLWINQSGNGWSDPITIRGTPPVGSTDAVRLVDLLGTGISGVLWSRDANTPGRDHMFFLDFTGGVKPYLLNEMDNHAGAVTRVEYAPSTQFYLDDEQRPETRWRTPLPFPVQVVARVEVVDAISRGKLTTEYSYHHGYWDGAEREFRGFGRVDQRDTEAFERYHAAGLHPDHPFEAVERQRFSPPTETRTWFHQGPVGEEFGDWEEADYSHEYWAGDPQLLEHTEQVNAFLRSYNSRPDGRASPADRRIKRAALRTLRGSMLRSELYALDDSSLQQRPYTVTEYAYNLREEARPGDSATRRERVFFPHRVAQRTTQWERGDDPMTQFTFTGDYDDLGQPHQRTNIAMPRRSAKRQKLIGAIVGELEGDEVNETRVLATHTRTTYAAPDPNLYLHDRVAQVRTFALKEPPEVDETDPDDLLQVLADQASAARSIHEHLRSAAESDVRLIGHRLNHYDGEAFVGRDAGEVGPYGALTRSEVLVFSEAELESAYGDRRPTYAGGNAPPPEGAPGDFGQRTGYRLEQGSGQYHAGYYADTQRQRFDVQTDGATQQRGMITAVQDPLGHQTTIAPDPYWLLPARVIDPAGLETHAVYDYRAMQPGQVTDPNGTTTHFRYTPLGLLHKQFRESRDGAGGTEEQPDITFTYDFLAYEGTREDEDPQPIFVLTRRRVRHASEDASDETIESREYSDGFGRSIQARAQAEELIFGETGDDVGLSPEPGVVDGSAAGQRAGERVVVSGWQVHNNKGEVIEAYEPFFAGGWAYQPASEAKQGRHVTHHYDPRGQRIRTVNPDGSEQRAIFGIPNQLDDPDDFAPTPWERYTYDPNDLATVSQDPDDPEQSLAERAPEAHHFTPASTTLDALGRAICQVQRNGPTPQTGWNITRSTYDLRGNLLTVTDALGRPAFAHAYDLLDNELKIESIDAGRRTSVLDATGHLIEYRDSKGSVVLRQYDELKRLTHVWARDDGNVPLTLRERLVYGDDEADSDLARDTAKQHNLLGQLLKHYDEAGLVTFERYDFKGNLEEQARQVIGDAALADGWTADWSKRHAEDDLDSFEYQTSTRYDALDRPVAIAYPADVNGQRAVLVPRYNRAGNLEQVELDGTSYVAQIAYNARGQRVLIAYGNGIMTRYAYNPYTFRLARLRTERYRERETGTFEGHGSPLQELTYHYDLAGNITSIEERTPGSGIASTRHGKDRLVRDFAYDPLYRLTEATGRACKDDGPAGTLHCGAYDRPYQEGAPAPNQHNAPELTAAYTERYTYDPAGNLLELQRAVGDSAWKRRFSFDDGSNRLETVTHGSTAQQFQYDANGNMIGENAERRYTWGHADRLLAFTNQPEGSDHASVTARYLYDASGRRVKKYVRKNGNGNGESTVYIDGIFEHHTWQEHGDRKENNHLHVMDDQHRIALVRRGPAHPRDAGPPVQFHLGDHLGSSQVVVDASGDWINREEYFPYGETSFGSFARKRYRFTGTERDEESGLSYHGARYYAPWLGRWVSCDPAGTVDGANLYTYCQGNPINVIDPDGTQSVEIVTNGTQSLEIVTDPFEAQEEKDDSSDEIHPDNFVLGSSGVFLRRDVPRSYYRSHVAEMDAARGYLKLAEIAEAGHGCAYCHTVKEYPTKAQANEAIDLRHYNQMAAGLALGRMTAEIFAGGPPLAATVRGTSTRRGSLVLEGSGTVSRVPPNQSSVPRPNPGESYMNYGTRVHQEFPRIVRETNPGASGQFNVAPGRTGPDLANPTGMNATFAEMKSLWTRQSEILRQARRWGLDPQTGRFFLYDRNTGIVFEGIIQTEKFPSGRFR